MRIFIVCPANTATGGPELLHQFSAALTGMGVENYMIYADMDCTRNPTPETFEKYHVRYVSAYVDAPDSVLVVPETGLHLLSVCVRGQALVWWLSVDNYLEECRLKGMDPHELLRRSAGRSGIHHFAQSRYAKNYLERETGMASVPFLSDYINTDIVSYALEHSGAHARENICLYNPKKGFENVKPLIERSGDEIRWVALSGLKPLEMARLMCRAKVYVDFGSHPGKDRIPREAAVCGCVVITNRKGSAAYREDVGIPDCYRLEEVTDAGSVLALIGRVMEDYEGQAAKYEDYRQKICNERAVFQKELLDAVYLLREACRGDYTAEMEDREALSEAAAMTVAGTDGLLDIVRRAEALIGGGDYAAAIDCLMGTDSFMNLIRESIFAMAGNLGDLPLAGSSVQE